MPGNSKHDRGSVPGSPRFATTRWTIVLAAGHKSSSDEARVALADLCSTYWYPLYAFVRKSGRSPAEAEDLTQAFFAYLLEKNVVGVAERARGRFRSFLLAAMKHFLSNQRDLAQALKRGGRQPVISLDGAAAESRYTIEPWHELTAEKLFQRQWAVTLLDRVLAALRDEYAVAGKDSLFAALKSCLAAAHQRADYRELAAHCGMSEGAVKVAVHRLRRRYRNRLRQEIAATLSDPADVADEIRELFGAFAR
jgi:RNA polymerase sigma-70 factor (ECF subfamily)